MASLLQHEILVDVAVGSWSCKNALAEALTLGDPGAVAGCIDFPELCGFSFGSTSDWDSRPSWAVLQRQTDVSAATMPASPP